MPPGRRWKEVRHNHSSPSPSSFYSSSTLVTACLRMSVLVLSCHPPSPLSVLFPVIIPSPSLLFFLPLCHFSFFLVIFLLSLFLLLLLFFHLLFGLPLFILPCNLSLIPHFSFPLPACHSSPSCHFFSLVSIPPPPPHHHLLIPLPVCH